MALINCKECNAQVSDKAKACPKCGAPIIINETFKCFECATELEKGTKTCFNCGAEQEVKEQPKVEEFKPSTINKNPQKLKKNNNILIWSLICGVALVLFIVIYIVVKNQSSSSYNESSNSNTSNSENTNNYSVSEQPREKTADELIQELLVKEKENPLGYLTVKYTLDVKVHLLKESEDIVNGTIYNSATMATFKDIGISVRFLTTTGALLDTKQYTLYEYVSPNGSKNFQIKVVSPSGTKKIGVDIISASAE